MKRLNPSTGKPFVRGDTRADGFLFWKYLTYRVKKNGFFTECWKSPESLNKTKQYLENWNIKNHEKVKDCYRKYNKKRAEQSKNYRKTYIKENRHKINAQTAKRRSIKLNATPPWLTKEHYIQIESVYAQAKQLTEQTGIPHEVDHIIPLNNKLVCGLHVPWNLEVKTAEANRKKSNSFQIHK